MQSAKIIRFCYRKIIDASSAGTWEKLVFDSSYSEFLMQAQFYNHEKKYRTFSELLSQVPGAEKLHFLVSASVTGYVQQLNGKMPDITDNLRRKFLSFKNFRFELIRSDINDKSTHQVAISFFSEPMNWHETIGEYLLVSPHTEEKNEQEMLTHLVQLQPFFSIYSIQEL